MVQKCIMGSSGGGVAFVEWCCLGAFTGYSPYRIIQSYSDSDGVQTITDGEYLQEGTGTTVNVKKACTVLHAKANSGVSNPLGTYQDLEVLSCSAGDNLSFNSSGSGSETWFVIG